MSRYRDIGNLTLGWLGFRWLAWFWWVSLDFEVLI